MGTTAQHRPQIDQGDRISQAGARLRTQWLENALTVPKLAPLTFFVARAHRERWPDPATVGAAVYDLDAVATYVHELEVKAGKGGGE
jgi:hypothetical protein